MKWLTTICLALLGVVLIWSQVSDDVKTTDPGVIGLRFSGYEWRVKISRGSVAPGPNIFGAGAATVDDLGRLHLRVYREGNRWICGEVISRRSFGYGEYRLVVTETADLDVNTVLGFFTWDSSAREKFFGEADVEISRWGEEDAPAAQFVLQPYVRSGNRVRLALPAGRGEFSFRWMPGRMVFKALAGGRVIHEHVFTKGVPEPGPETNVRLNIWQYRSVPPANGKNVEAVIESFKFLP
jgi:hypothetical protein